MVRYALVTFGCRVNQADSQRLEAALAARGAHPAPPTEADLVIVNTCSVTCTADQSARQAIRRLHRLNRHARIVATGCYATRRPDEVAGLPGVWRVVPNQEKDGLCDALAAVGALGTAERFGGGEGPCGAPWPGLAGRTALTVRVQTGCDERCTYCIIPSTRGSGRSTPPEAVVAEIARAVAVGFKEIVLTGVHLGSYGRDLTPRTTLLELLRTLAAQPWRVLFRVSALEPMDCPPALVELVAASPCLAPHFHLPLQHASDTVLQAMGRPYRLDDFRRLVDLVRERLPHAAIGSDIIVGFPGETDEDFERLVRYLECSPLTYLHVFPYSDRPGTAAAAMPGRVPGAIVRERGRRVRAIGDHLVARFRASQLGAVRPGLTIEDGSMVVTDNYLKVRIAPGVPRNTWVQVRLTGDGASMVGELV